MLKINKLVVTSVLLILVVVIILMLLIHSRAPFGKGNSSFAADPEKEITRIEFSEGERRMTLEKNGASWLINGKNETRKNGILFILKILREIQIKSPVSDELFKAEISEKSIAPIKVKVYENRKLLRSFLVYKTISNSYGNIMKVKENSNPFIVYVPGYDNNIGSAFTLNELFWQPYTVFNFLPSQIGSVEFENVLDTSASFSISFKYGHYILTDRSRDLTGYDSTFLTRYLSYFTSIPFESWAFDMDSEQKRKVESFDPLYRITVNSTEGYQTVLTLWEKLKDDNTRDTDRLYGKTQKSDQFFVIRYFDIDPIIKKRSYFFHE
jgi:hypothetical protein